jgi:polyisoprenoid-binding protein YceI
MARGALMRHWKRLLAIGIGGLAVLLVGGPYVYIHFVEGKAPAPLTLTTPSAIPAASSSPTAGQPTSADAGTWNVTTGSLVGYRVKEVLFGQSNVAVGRTGEITGSITVDGTKVTAGTFTVDMTTVTSDESRRDGQFQGRIMETATYPTATFKLTQPIDLGSIPSAGVQKTFQANGELTLHGVTKTVTFQLTARHTDSTIQVAGSIPITFADYNIANPSFGSAVTTEDNGILEFALNFTQG